MPHTIVGTALPRKEGAAKVTGKALYVDDLPMAPINFGTTIRSQVAKGIIKNIQLLDGPNWPEFTIVTAKDIPGQNAIALIEPDQPFLADGIINHNEEPIVLLAHSDRHQLEWAKSFVKIEIDELKPVLDFESAAETFKTIELNKGDIANAFAKADQIIEGEYRTGAQEQLYIEPNGVIAKWSDKDGITIWGSMQCPYYVHKALMPLFALPNDKVRVIQTETGGGFGGKEDYPNILAGHAALLAKKSGQAVKMIYDRAEDMAATTKRHPALIRHKTAVAKDGQILGMDIEFVVDGGAYTTLSPVVASRGTLHATGPYFCENIRIRSKAVKTNHPPNGAFRGFGAPQTVFAIERQMDAIANKLGLSRESVRQRNFLQAGKSMATGQTMSQSIDMNALFVRALAESEYHAKRQLFDAQNKTEKIKHGIGFATFMHGAGFTGSGEKMLASIAGVERLADGKVRVLTSCIEMGQGTNTVFTQIAAETLGIDPSLVEMAPPDTHFVPNSGPTVASRTTMIVGKLIRDACIKMREQGLQKAFAQYEQPPDVQWDEHAYKGDAYPCYAWAVYVAEVSVDVRTYEMRVDKMLCLQDVGQVVHPILAAGQIEGGAMQGVGYALYENVVWQNGRMKNNQMTNYVIPTTVDAPNIRVLFEETPSHHGPFGAIGIGELPLDGAAPAVISAVEHATGIRPNKIPFLPEDLMAALEKKHDRN